MMNDRTGFSVLTCLILAVFLAMTAAAFGQSAGHFDVLIVNGRVMDGTGNPWFYADIGIRDGKIAAVGRLKDNASAGRTIDATGRMVVPGFIDLHDHAYDPVRTGNEWRGENEKRYCAPNFIGQGITTLVCNQCGGGPLSIAGQIKALTEHGIGPNTVLLIGHNTVRRHVLGDDHKRNATPAEIEEMKKLVRTAMEEGAWGMSAGLEYVPGIWSDIGEMVALAGVVARFGGLYQVHERGSGADPMWYLPSQDEPGQASLLDNIVELIEVSERTGVRAIATHIKARGAHYWGSSRAAINLIEEARARGVDIWADCYPYNTTGSDGSTVIIPRWALGRNPRDGLLKTLEDPEKTKDMRLDMTHEIARRGSAENIVVMDYPDKSFVGKTLAELAKEHGLSVVDLAIKMQLEGYPDRRGGARLRGFSLSEIDVEAYSAQPWCATSTDASITLPSDGPVHVRYYGSYPRKIQHYAMTRGVISLEDAIRSSTSLPAQIIGLRDRGMIREGYQADIVVFDLETIRDIATFFEPHQYPEGIDYVLVNGTCVVDKGELTWKRPGVVITP